jgi:hypothetical protein
MPFLRASNTILRTAESRTLTVEGESASMVARYSIRRARLRGRPAEKANRSLRGAPQEREIYVVRRETGKE